MGRRVDCLPTHDSKTLVMPHPTNKQAGTPEKYQGIDFKPPQAVADAAKKGLEYRQKATPGNKGGLTPAEAAKQGIGSGVQRATNLKNRDNISPEVINQMVSFFARHEKNKSVAPKYENEPWKDKGHVAWLLWGGNPGKTWVEKVKSQMDKADGNPKKARNSLRSRAIRLAYQNPGIRPYLLPILKNT